MASLILMEGLVNIPPDLLTSLVDKALTERGVLAHIKARQWKEIQDNYKSDEVKGDINDYDPSSISAQNSMTQFVKNSMHKCGKCT